MENDLLAYWKVFFETTYFLRISTFYFEWNQLTQTWECRTSISQKVICFVLTVCVIIFSTITRLHSSQWHEANSPLLYFDISTVLSVVFYFGSFIYINWIKHDSFLQVFKHIQRNLKNNGRLSLDMQGKHNGADCTASLFNEKILKLFYLSIILTMAFLPPVSMLYLAQWDPNRFLRVYEKLSSALFFETDPSTLPNVCIILTILMELLSKLVLLFVDVLFISTTLMFRALVKKFLNELRNTDETPVRVIESYKNLKRIVILINNAVGAATFASTLGALAFYCEIIAGMAKMRLLIFFRMIFYLTYLISSIVMASRSHNEVGQIYDWLYTRATYNRIPHVDLHLLLYDISLSDIGLSSGGRPISYKFLGSLLGLTATYVVLRFQFNDVSV